MKSINNKMKKFLRPALFNIFWGLIVLVHMQVSKFYFPSEEQKIHSMLTIAFIIGLSGYVIVEIVCRKLNLNELSIWLIAVAYLAIITFNFGTIVSIGA